MTHTHRLAALTAQCPCSHFPKLMTHAQQLAALTVQRPCTHTTIFSRCVRSNHPRRGCARVRSYRPSLLQTCRRVDSAIFLSSSGRLHETSGSYLTWPCNLSTLRINRDASRTRRVLFALGFFVISKKKRIFPDFFRRLFKLVRKILRNYHQMSMD